MRFISGVLATFIACGSLAKADCSWIGDESQPCDFWSGSGDSLCNQVCRMQGDDSGYCEPRAGCEQYDYHTCVCSPARKRDGGLAEDDVEVEVKEFIRAKTKDLGDEAQVGVEKFLRTLTEDLHGEGEGEAEEFIGAMKKHIDGDGDANAEEFLRAMTNNEDNDVPEKVEARDALEKRSITCSAPMFEGYMCHAHCWALDKTGGACNSIDNVCICYDN